MSEITNFCDVKINNGDIIISDISNDYINGLKVKIWNNKSQSQILISGFDGVKYFENDNQKYYLIYTKKFDVKNNIFINNTILINNNIELIPN